MIKTYIFSDRKGSIYHVICKDYEGFKRMVIFYGQMKAAIGETGENPANKLLTGGFRGTI